MPGFCVSNACIVEEYDFSSKIVKTFISHTVVLKLKFHVYTLVHHDRIMYLVVLKRKNNELCVF